MTLDKIHSSLLRHSPAIILNIILLLLSLALTCKAPAYAEDNRIQEDKLKAVFLYNFTKFVSWSPLTSPKTNQTINICISGKTALNALLEPVTHMKSGDKAITIENIDDLRDLERKNCQILFISESEEGNIKDILKKISTLHILTVSDAEGFADHGGIIGFVVKDDKLRLEINLNAARRAGLTISAKLLEIATIIQ